MKIVLPRNKIMTGERETVRRGERLGDPVPRHLSEELCRFHEERVQREMAAHSKRRVDISRNYGSKMVNCVACGVLFESFIDSGRRWRKTCSDACMGSRKLRKEQYVSRWAGAEVRRDDEILDVLFEYGPQATGKLHGLAASMGVKWGDGSYIYQRLNRLIELGLIVSDGGGLRGGCFVRLVDGVKRNAM